MVELELLAAGGCDWPAQNALRKNNRNFEKQLLQAALDFWTLQSSELALPLGVFFACGFHQHLHVPCVVDIYLCILFLLTRLVLQSSATLPCPPSYFPLRLAHKS